MQSLTWAIRGGLAAALLGLAWMVWPSQQPDRWYQPRVASPAFTARPWPRILFDEAHVNTHTANGLYRPFTRLLQRDGFRVVAAEGTLTIPMLNSADVFVTVNPLGYKGLAQHLATLAQLDGLLSFDADAFSTGEIQGLTTWVDRGGRALIVADRGPAGLAARRLVRAFGVDMTNSWAADHGHAEITFTRANGGLAEHPITHGRSSAERIENVMMLTGVGLKGPSDAEAVLKLPNGGLAQAIALRRGKGRVVVVGNAAALTAQRIDVAGATPILIGMNRAGVDNQQFALNIIHWLIGMIE